MKVYVLMRGYYDETTMAAVVTESRKADVDKLCELCIDTWLVELELDAMPIVRDPGADHFTVELTRDGNPKARKSATRLDSGGLLHYSLATLETSSANMKRWRLRWRGYAKSEVDANLAAVEMRRAILAGELAPDEHGRFPVSLDAVSPDWKAPDGG